MRYKLTDHTADIGIRLKNKDLPGLFEDAAWSMFDLLCDVKKVRASFKRLVSAEADNYEELLNEFLNNLLKEYTAENNLIKDVKIKKVAMDGDRAVLFAQVSGEAYNPNRHTIKTEIKAVTFHNLAVKKTRAGYTAEVVFDV